MSLFPDSIFNLRLFKCHLLYLCNDCRVVHRARVFQVGSGSSRVWAWILNNCRASIGPDVGPKSRFSLSDKVFMIAKKS